MARSILGSVAIVVGLASGFAAEEPARVVYRERALVQRVHWPVALLPLTARGCDGLSPTDIRVLDGGREARVTKVERSRLPTLHGLLIDTSASMHERLEEVQAAALRYLRVLPEQDRALLAAFDDDLVLLAGRQADAGARAGAIVRLRAGTATALWEALESFAAYLASQPGRKVLVLLSDGCNTVERVPGAFERALQTVSQAEQLTVFAIGLALPQTCPKTGEDPRQGLRRLAERTGGRVFEATRADELRGPFEQILDQLRHEGYVVFEPPAPDDNPEGEVAREVSLIRASAVPCALRSAGAPLRYVRPRASENMDLVAAGALRERAWSASWPRAWRAAGGGGVGLRLEGEWWRGELVDLLLDAGSLYDLEAWFTWGQVRLHADRPARFGARPVEILAPPLARVVGEIRDVGTALQAVLERGRVPDWPSLSGTQPAAWEPGGAPVLLSGSGFLALREELARQLFTHPDYRAWVFEHARKEAEEQFQRLVAESTETLTEEERRQFRAVVLAQAARPSAETVARRLGGWLGDVPAREAFDALERALVHRAFAEGSLSAAARHALEVWPRLRRVFGPPARVRVVALLVPAYDPVAEEIGFYRIVLPRPRPGRWPLDTVRASPRALETAAWLLQIPAIREKLEGKVREVAVTYRSPDPEDFVRARRGRRAALVGGLENAEVVELRLRAEEAARAFALRVYWPAGATAPGAVVFEEGTSESASRAVLADPQALVDLLHNAGW